METKDLIINYVKSLQEKKRDAIIMDIINEWEYFRCADGAESIADKENKDDLCIIVRQYSSEQTINVLNDSHRFFLIGENFPKPEPIEDMFATFMGLAADIAETYAQFLENYEPMIPASAILKMMFNRGNE